MRYCLWFSSPLSAVTILAAATRQFFWEISEIDYIPFKMSNINDFWKQYGKQTTTNFDLNKIANQLGIKNFHLLMRNELQLIKDVRSTNSANKPIPYKCNVLI